MRLSIAIFATCLATITVALPTTSGKYPPILPLPLKPPVIPITNKLILSTSLVADAGIFPSNPTNGPIFTYGDGPNAKETREQQQRKRCDVTDLECWQRGGHAVERRESKSGPVYGIPVALDV